MKCRKCGFENPEGLKFCGNCGSRLNVVEPSRFESLAFLQLAGSLYLLISLIFNALVQASLLFVIPYLLSCLLGLYSSYMFYVGRVGREVKVVSALAIALGLSFTLLLFLIGLGVRGVIGPAWVIFLISAWVLWRTRKQT